MLFPKIFGRSNLADAMDGIQITSKRNLIFIRYVYKKPMPVSRDDLFILVDGTKDKKGP